MKHPNVEKAYNKFVIEKKDKTQAEFWKEYFEAKMFYENKTKKDLLASVSAKNQPVSNNIIADDDSDKFVGESVGICSEINAKSFKIAGTYGGNDGSKNLDPYRRQAPLQTTPEKRELNDNEAPLPRKLMRLPRQTEYSQFVSPVTENERDENNIIKEGNNESENGENEDKTPSQLIDSDKGAQDFQNLVKESVRIERKDDFSDLILCPEYNFIKRECDKVHSLCMEVWSRVPSNASSDIMVIKAKLKHMDETIANLERMMTVAEAKMTSDNKNEIIGALNGLCDLLKHTIPKIRQIKNL